MSVPIIEAGISLKGKLDGEYFGENHGVEIKLWYSEEEKSRVIGLLYKLAGQLEEEING